MLRIFFKSTDHVAKFKLCFTYSRLVMYSKLVSPILATEVRVQKYSDLLSNYGFNPGQMGRIFKSSHCVLSLTEKELLSNLMNWLNFDVKDKLFTALSAYPELLTLNPDFVNSRAKELMTLFTKKDINKLLVTCPHVFLDEFADIHLRVQYIVASMGVEQNSIVKSHALQFDLFHIKCRHNFMVRAGCYIVKKRATKCLNPPLHKIFSRNIETFLKLTKLTEEEYLVFLECFKDEENLDLDVDSDDEL